MAKKKTTKKAAAKKTTTKPAPKQTATTPQHPGVIAFMVTCLKQKPHSKAELLAKLAKKFPDRQAEAMKKTIGCQLPSRLSKKFEISKDAEGRFSIAK